MISLVNLAGHTVDSSCIPERPRVLDVGSRNYSFTEAMLKLRPQSVIVCVEPDYTVKEREGVTLKRGALVGGRGGMRLYVSYSTGEGNYIVDDQERARPAQAGIADVPAFNIRDITDASKLEKWDVVKLDCEGSEFGILEDWPLGGIARQITVEFHDFKNHLRWNQAYFNWLWTQLPDYSVVQHKLSRQGEALSHWDTLLRRSV